MAAIVGLLALILSIEGEWWWIAGGCYSTRSLICCFLWLAAVGVMFLHHSVQPRLPWRRLADRDLLELAGDAVIFVFAAALVAWFLVYQVEFFIPHETYDGELAHVATSTLQQRIGLVVKILFPIAALVTFARLTKEGSR